MQRKECFKTLLSAFQELICDDYILLDLPYYENVGDMMIWQATIDILKYVNHKCLYSSDIYTYRKPSIPKTTIIVFLGGGNFGDIWPEHQSFRHHVMRDFPENTIVQLPQSVWFDSKDAMEEDVNCFAEHGAPVFVCLREKQSFGIIRDNYTNVVPVLLPDTALSLNISYKAKNRNAQKKRRLYFHRKDKERTNINIPITANDEKDWPIIESPNSNFYYYIYNIFSQWINKIKPGWPRFKMFTQWYYCNVLKKVYIGDGIRFLSKYDEIYADRLHAAVLACLMGKNVFIIDNSYHKCSEVYNLWMSDYDNVKLFH